MTIVPFDDTVSFQAGGTASRTADVVVAVGPGGLALGAGQPAAALVDKSGTITLGGTAQVLTAANTSRTGFMIQNQSAGDLWFNTLATAVASQPSIRIQPGDMYETPASGVPTGAISIIGATTAQAFAAREW